MKNCNFIFLLVFFSIINSCQKHTNDHSDSNLTLDDKVENAKLNDEVEETFKNKTSNYSFLKYENVKISLQNEKSLNVENIESNGVFNSSLYISYMNNIVDSLLYNNIEPNGSSYGIYFCKDLFCNYYIALKYGDYEGKTILIKNDGKMFEINGGIPYLDHENNILISDYYSDIQGFSIFSLINNNLLLDIEIEGQINTFYYYKNEYYVSIFDFEDNINILKKIDMYNKKLLSTKVKINEINGYELELLFDPTNNIKK